MKNFSGKTNSTRTTGSENPAAFNKTRLGIDHCYRNFLTLVDNLPVYRIGVHMAAKTLKKVDGESYHDPHKPVDQLLVFVYDHIDAVIFPAHGQEQRTVETRQPATSFRVGTTNRLLPTPPLQQIETPQPTITYSYQSVNHQCTLTYHTYTVLTVKSIR